ncbi:hypothetical protein [Moraxella equi]|uniref:Predicted NTPase (NACHT family) n=1 Tax=Moraxella equi TaxID=60442 RepID=A0A378QR94_9GAMM|nr:hypothetical protein [Moraxella equi]OPH39665.1 hypothetical protein B5J93_03255 [Moraxella equi]STZ03201.1 Predicted NTPase (NACHT family) [Moraxella equi]
MIYIPRLLQNSDERKFTELQLLSEKQKIIVILAEPGAGKSYLLDNLAQQLGIKKNAANIFAHSNPKVCLSLLIDGLDELVRVDSSAITKVLVMAESTGAEKIILSSRSSEWSQSHTQQCKEIFNTEPLLLYLQPFNTEEQQHFFHSHYPQHDAKHFLAEAEKIELTPLLSNPLFLKLFSNSYIKNNQYFENRHSAFKTAIEDLAKENNPNHSSALPFTKKIELAEDVFCKLMLSGSEGVSIADLSSTQFFPNISTLNGDKDITQILSTKLFVPNDVVGQHRPAHRVVAEYCAGNFLAKKITATSNPLSLNKILSIIAPNHVVRDELRGLFAWMTVLSHNDRIQETLINFDPYAILSNGDPSLLPLSSKKKLLLKLKELNQEDPYFRRGDIWRDLRISNFFDDNMLDELKELLSDKYRNGHLQRLILELLLESPVLSQLSNELNAIVLDTRDEYKEWFIRILAGQCLLNIKDHPIKATWDKLINESDRISLTIAGDMMSGEINPIFELKDYVCFLRKCADLYPTKYDFNIVIGERYFIQYFIQKLDLDLTTQLLDELSQNLSCTCQEIYDCQCRVGVSKIIGRLLDRYFELSHAPFDSEKIWLWVKNLYFKNNVSKEQSLSVKVLSENHELRQNIIKLVFEKLSNAEEIDEIRIFYFSHHGHCGLYLQHDDYKYIIDLAFSIKNIELWKSFVVRHDIYSKSKSSSFFRRYMRNQALQNLEFLRAWYGIEQKYKKLRRNMPRKRYRKKIAKNRKRQEAIYDEQIKYIQKNKELIESGEYWNALLNFSYVVLQEPKNIVEKFGDEYLVRNALYNCLDFVAPDVPSLTELANLHCRSKSLYVETVLYASCLERLKRDNSLQSVPEYILKALYTKFNTYWLGMNQDDMNFLMSEVKKCLFTNEDKIRQFLVEYIEPQLACGDCKHTQVDWLNCEPFNVLQEELSWCWLEKYPNLNLDSLENLMKMVIKYGNIEKLKSLIYQRCQDFLNTNINHQDKSEKERRDFWFVHAFYLLDTDYEIFWEVLVQDLDSIFILNKHLGTFGDYRKWLVLPAKKVELILDTFFDKYPEVELPDSYGTDSPNNEKAYRFLRNVIFLLGRDETDNPIPVIDRLLSQSKYKKLHLDLKSIRFDYQKKLAIKNFQGPRLNKLLNY